MARRPRTLAILGANVRAARTARGLTQASLAERSDLAVETISRLEGGLINVTVEAVEQLARALDLEIVALFDARPPKVTHKVRPALAKVIALIERLPDPDLADILVGLRALLRVRGHAGRKRSSS